MDNDQLVCCLCQRPIGAGDSPVLLSTQAHDAEPCAHQLCAWDFEHERRFERAEDEQTERMLDNQIWDDQSLAGREA